ncbi:hypothetical protein [Stakelama pacifica]|uniref:Uncharacterized protein n=1 Tax=Stakelama pacifica TaxID=517720 RepID=A0A4R6FB77_9SPHN|nr:hypothetical protein [Stakelama pacifica]TDN78409.1 hypothetical protein EV664_11729 [Stakelama pacifica]GGO99535.1 hypothetical protein GCM10011329_33260 [Stakelama pacifica]
MLQSLAVLAALSVPLAPAHPATPDAAPQAGDVFALEKELRTETSDSSGSTGSSFDRDTLTERVIATRPNGMVLEYDIANAASETRDSNWQFPVRVLQAQDGSIRHLNRDEVAARVDPWLKKAGFSRQDCGKWIFTWNAFQIQCDPDLALETVKQFRLPIALTAGEPFQHPMALKPSPLDYIAGEKAASTYRATLTINPDAVKRQEAETDVEVARLSGKTLTLDEAQSAHAKEKISGTITVIFRVDANGGISSRETTTKVAIEAPDGTVKNRIATETLTKSLAKRDAI